MDVLKLIKSKVDKFGGVYLGAEDVLKIMTFIENYSCQICNGEGWVCEEHSDKQWKEGRGCCGGSGKPCECNRKSPAWHFKNLNTYGENGELA